MKAIKNYQDILKKMSITTNRINFTRSVSNFFKGFRFKPLKNSDEQNVIPYSRLKNKGIARYEYNIDDYTE